MVGTFFPMLKSHNIYLPLKRNISRIRFIKLTGKFMSKKNCAGNCARCKTITYAG
jgi:hypothetical protein